MPTLYNSTVILAKQKTFKWAYDFADFFISPYFRVSCVRKNKGEKGRDRKKRQKMVYLEPWLLVASTGHDKYKKKGKREKKVTNTRIK